MQTDHFVFNFNEWMNLQIADPMAFEARKQALMNALIKRASPHHRHRLKGLQFQINAQFKLSKNPLILAMKSAKLMWENVDKLCHELKSLDFKNKSSVKSPANCEHLLYFPLRKIAFDE